MRSVSPAVLLVAVVLSSPGLSQGPQLVVVSSPALVQLANGRQVVDFTLANNAEQAITAWEVSVKATYSDTRVEETWMMKEAYLAYVRLEADKSYVLPHGSNIERFQLGAPRANASVVDVEMAVRWAIFADGSAIGNARGIEEALQQRERDYRAFSFVVSALDAGRAAGPGPDSLSVALQALNAPNQEDYAHSVKTLTRRNIQVTIERHLPLEDFLCEQLAMAREMMQAADVHRHAKRSIR
jgi:hypothetical protein